ncbi:hypothetical protein KKF32_02270 [Patescibacteria group bacterium]|nr:hypothetical protein [Patescibacteria group bacterium]
MYKTKDRYASYKRAVIYFVLYSTYFFFTTPAKFLSWQSLLYFLIGFMLSGFFAAIFMMLQYKIEKKLNPNYWILNIIIEIVGYFFFTKILFSLFF